MAERSKALDSGLPGCILGNLLVRKGVGSNPTLVILLATSCVIHQGRTWGCAVAGNEDIQRC